MFLVCLLSWGLHFQSFNQTNFFIITAVLFLQSAVIFFGVLLARLKYGKTNAVLFTTYIGSSMSNLQAIIEAAFEKRAEITPKNR